MTTTLVGVGDSKAVKRWSGLLFSEVAKKSYFERKFIGTSDNNVIQRLTELDDDPGDQISFDLSVQLRQRPVYGDNRLKGKEEALRFYTDSVYIDQVRHGVSLGGKMTNKRTVHNLRMVGKDKLSEYFAKFIDEMIFVYLSGARGINEDFIEDTAWAGHAGNAIQAPDTGHLLYGGNATAKDNVDSSDKMGKDLLERAEVKARSMRMTDPTLSSMVPVEINGEDHYVCVMSPFQAYDLRVADTSGWVDIVKAAAAAEGRNSPIFKGGLGMINNIVLHDHQSVIRFSDYGSGVNLAAARALLLGRQAAVVAYGSKTGLRWNWTEEVEDHENEVTIGAGAIIGIKKSRFNSKDFGCLSLDTYAANPNP